MTGLAHLRQGQRAVVTGAGGFLGKHLMAWLGREGIEAVGVGRATGFKLLEDTLPLDGVAHVFHLAAETGVPDSWEDPVKFHLVNTHGTVRVLDQCRRAKCSMTFVGGYPYGVPERLPIPEEHPVRANNPYAFSKHMGEQACAWYAETYGLSVTALRLFNVYGPGQSDRFLVQRIVSQVLDPKVSAIELMDLAPRRDYLFVDDAVLALLAAVPASGFHLFNVGYGESCSVGEVVTAVMTAAGIHKPVVDKGQPRPNEIPDVVADTSRLRAASGWRPQIGLVAGVQRIIAESAAS